MKKRLPKYLQLNKFIIVYLVALFIGYSCTSGLRIEKRKYNKGFYTSKTKGNSSNKEVNRNSNNKTLLHGFSNKHPKNEYLETNTKPTNNPSLLANSEKNVFCIMSQSTTNEQSNTEFNIIDRPFDKNGVVFTAPFNESEQIQIFNSDSCLITLNKGGEIKCKVIGINKNSIRFRSSLNKNNIYTLQTRKIEKIECYRIDPFCAQTYESDSLFNALKVNVLNDDIVESKYSMIFGILSLIIVPELSFLSFVSAVLGAVEIVPVFVAICIPFIAMAIYYGLKVKRRNTATNKKILERAQFGRKVGSLMLLILAATIVAAILLL